MLIKHLIALPVIIETDKLNKWYKGAEDFHALIDVSVQIQEGEFVSIVGQSGSGKSTLLYVLSTLDTDYTGRISVAGSDLKKLNKNQLASFRNASIGFVFQFHYLLPEFTVLENVCLPALKLAKFDEDQIEEMALQKMHEIREAIFAQYELTCMHVYHSLGKVATGEISLFVFTYSKHRKAAINACEELVENIKSSLPIWGKELFTNETYQWKENK
jgi:ABC-type transporter Mla maintaining outer membrane lipid asymmetry ATPase subunit MlaF